MKNPGSLDDRLALERAEFLLRDREMPHAAMCCAAVREELYRTDVEALATLILTAQRRSLAEMAV